MTSKGFGLELADGTSLRIVAADCRTKPVVELMAGAMDLRPSSRGRLLLAAVGEPGKDRVQGCWDHVCLLGPPEGEDMLIIQATRLSLAVARQVQARGGMLMHGALASLDGQGVIMAAPGCTGKSTASRRLPSPWRSLCDDATLVVRDSHGQYWAHPWPTWSQFFDGGPGGIWDVQQAVPLRAIFFLFQSQEDFVEPINRSQAEAMIVESVEQITRTMTMRLQNADITKVHREQLLAASGLADTIPAFILNISLTGRFWEHLEKALSGLEKPPIKKAEPSTGKRTPDLDTISDSRGAIPVVLTGSSMSPTLNVPDLMEVVPCNRPPRRGDVIYFQEPLEQKMVVHRVTAITPEGISTHGDNNSSEDPYLVQLKDVVGKVVSAENSTGKRMIPGGMQGLIQMHKVRVRRRISGSFRHALSSSYRGLANAGLIQRVLPSAMRPRVVSFGTEYKQCLKLMLGKRVIGQYDRRTNAWQIRPPFRLLADEAALPRLSWPPKRKTKGIYEFGLLAQGTPETRER
ncbi:MAG TPA: SynChlorMet cassette protein ScmC [Methanotrichaceae archaeon]|nr:SynChlorMet cassette protein ScmC [Methanotrichaceae archaeon]